MTHLTKIVLVVFAVFITTCALAMRPESPSIEGRHNLFRFSHPFVMDRALPVPNALSNFDVKKIRVLDAQGIINGANISAIRKIELFSMLDDADLAAREFGLFLDSAFFPDNSNFIQEQGDRILSIVHETLKVTGNSDNLARAEKIHTLLQSACNFARRQTVVNRELDYMDLANHVLHGVSSLSKEGENSTAMTQLREFLTSELEETVYRFSFKSRVFKVVCSSIETEAYRGALIAFLAAFEHKKTTVPNLLTRFVFKGDDGSEPEYGYIGDKEITVAEDGEPQSSYVCRPYTAIYQINKKELLTFRLPLKEEEKRYLSLPFLMGQPGEDFCERTFGYSYFVFHEIGKMTFALLDIDSRTFYSICDFVAIDEPEFVHNIVSPRLDEKRSERLDSFMEIGLKWLFPSGIPSDYIPFIENMASSLAWKDRHEILQIIGIYMDEGTLLVSKLSDLDLSISEMASPRWTALDAKTKELLSKTGIRSPKESDMEVLFFLRGLDYESYKKRL